MKRLLIIIDYQNDFVCAALGFEKARLIEPKIAGLIAEYRKSGDDVAFTLDAHDENYLQTTEGKKLPVPHCLNATPGQELYGEVKNLRRPQDRVFIKSKFGSDELYHYLKRAEYGKITLVGVVTNICVITNAVLAQTAASKTEIAVDAQCVAAQDERLNAAALDVMESLHITIENR